MSTRQANEVGGAGAGLARNSDRLLNVLLAVDFLLFAGGAVAHSGIPIPPRVWHLGRTPVGSGSDHRGRRCRRPVIYIGRRRPGELGVPNLLVGLVVLLRGCVMGDGTARSRIDPWGAHDDQRLSPYRHDVGDHRCVGTTSQLAFVATRSQVVGNRALQHPISADPDEHPQAQYG